MKSSNRRKASAFSASSIRLRYGRGWPGYEEAKAAFLKKFPRANSDEIRKAMRLISRACGV